MSDSEVPDGVLRRSIAETIHFGEVEIVHTEDSVYAQDLGDDPLRVTLRRLGERTDPRTPLGTRDGACIRADIGGQPMTVRVGPAKLTKKSYEVAASSETVAVRLTPRSMSTSQVITTRVDDAWNNVLGEVTRLDDGSMLVIWRRPFEFMKTKVEPPAPTREDALVLLVLGAALGTGGLSVGTILASAADSLFH